MPKYDKLVRDKYPELIKEKNPKFRVASKEEYRQKLREKIVEEAEELLGSASKEELADILEVVDHYVEAEKWDAREIRDIRKRKAAEKGSFKKRIILIQTD